MFFFLNSQIANGQHFWGTDFVRENSEKKIEAFISCSRNVAEWITYIGKSGGSLGMEVFLSCGKPCWSPFKQGLGHKKYSLYKVYMYIYKVYMGFKNLGALIWRGFLPPFSLVIQKGRLLTSAGGNAVSPASQPQRFNFWIKESIGVWLGTHWYSCLPEWTRSLGPNFFASWPLDLFEIHVTKEGYNPYIYKWI